ncbi:MAG TPA: zonular occludens toxin domain-containing protein [Kamptonema sp.]|nr:zonular occludens toxin domain-containing protein [Kamptonema sp.]
MAITAFIGRQGAGKTLEMTWVGLHLALKYGKRFVCNYALDLDYLLRFAISISSKNLIHLIKSGDIICCPGNVDYLLAVPDSVVCIDEIAIYLGDSTESPQKTKYLIARFNQCRRRGIELLYVAHSLDRVQKYLRTATNNVCYCDGAVTRMNNGDIYLKSERYYYFNIDDYDYWVNSPKRHKFIFGEWFTKSKAFHIHKSVLTCFKRDFFKAFDSFSDITNDANSAFLLRYKKLSFPGSVYTFPQPLVPINNSIESLKAKASERLSRNVRKSQFLLLILKLIRLFLKDLLRSSTMKKNSDYLSNYDFIKLHHSRRNWSLVSPIDERLCVLIPPNRLDVFISCLTEDLPPLSRLKAEAVFKVFLFKILPAGLEDIAINLAKILGSGWSLPFNSSLLEYKKPSRV